MKDPYAVIKRPLITEKGMGASAMGKYVFEVDINANKIEIADAVKKIFPTVDVVKVNTLHVKGKSKRMGRMTQGKTADWKKAYVTLKAGQHIEIFEGA
ncbi:MAG: 50S ribosomal protein L23 [Armatimonadota bacterium]